MVTGSHYHENFFSFTGQIQKKNIRFDSYAAIIISVQNRVHCSCKQTCLYTSYTPEGGKQREPASLCLVCRMHTSRSAGSYPILYIDDDGCIHCSCQNTCFFLLIDQWRKEFYHNSKPGRTQLFRGSHSSPILSFSYPSYFLNHHTTQSAAKATTGSGTERARFVNGCL